MKKILASYKNGNYRTILLSDGTKIRSAADDVEEFKPEFPENIDLCITKRCTVGCSFCYESSTPDGEYANIMKLVTFIKKLQPGTELAIGGGGLSSYPYLGTVLSVCNSNHVVANATVNQYELENDAKFLEFIEQHLKHKFIHGLGISFGHPSPLLERLNEEYPDSIVIHTINGITRPEDYGYLISHNFKVLVLGYKTFGRGKNYKREFSQYITKRQKYLEDNISSFMKKARLISFDNLALEQLDIKNKLSKEDWNAYYMGDDGNYTMYVDAVNEIYGKNSVQPREKCKHFSLETDTAEQLFKELQKEKILGK